VRRYKDPWDADAERAVLGAMVTSERAAEQALGELSETDFYGENHRAVFRAAQALHERRESLDHVGVAVEVASQGFHGASDARKLLFQLVEAVPTVSGMPRWIKSLKDHSMRRGVLARAEVVVQAAASSDEDPLVAVEDLNAFATDTQEGDGVQTFGAAHQDYIERVMLRKAGETTMGIPTGLTNLDKATTGWHGGDLIVIGARPSMAKTLYVWQSAITAARHGNSAFVMNLEMAFSRIQERCACATSGVSYEAWRRGKIDANDAEKLMSAHQELTKLPISVHNPRAGCTVEDMKRALRALRPHIAYVDYLQLLRTSKVKSGDLYTRVTSISNDLKQMALELDIPIIAVSQLSRSVEDRLDKRPIMSDLRESGYIEQDADVILMMYRDAYYYPEGVRDGRNGPETVPNFHPQKVEFIARKDREGGNWTVNAFFSGPRMWLSEQPYHRKVGVA
jgi:replicative DNA helicase